MGLENVPHVLRRGYALLLQSSSMARWFLIWLVGGDDGFEHLKLLLCHHCWFDDASAVMRSCPHDDCDQHWLLLSTLSLG